jgi:hypothetical protein
MKVGYMGFQKVIDTVRDGVDELLKRTNVLGVPAIFDMLQVLLEDLEAFKPVEQYVWLYCVVLCRIASYRIASYRIACSRTVSCLSLY